MKFCADVQISAQFEFLVGTGQQVRSSDQTGTSSKSTTTGRSPVASTFENLSLDVGINLHRDIWIRHENAEIELDGSVSIKKRPASSMTLVGEVNTVQGWLDFHGKRFDLVSGRILFTGGSVINPSLRIDAQYVIDEYTIQIIVTGTARQPEIKFQSQPQLAQADILSLILFGTTTSQLSQDQKSSLRQQAQSLALGAAGQTIAQSLGLDSFGINVSGKSVSIGHYVGENTYVSIAPNLSTTTTGTPTEVASVRYFLRRWLNITTATMSDGSRQLSININQRY